MRSLIAARPPTDTIHYLPALYVNLDPAGIPSPNELDRLLLTLSPMPTVALATLAVDALTLYMQAGNLTERDGFSELWVRLWKWLEFLNTYWDLLPASKLPTRTQEMMAGIYSGLILHLKEDPRTSRLICATPGVRRYLAMAWRATLHDDAAVAEPEFFDAMTAILSVFTDRIQDDSNFTEMVEGAGGSFQDLASVVIRHIRVAVATPTFDVPQYLSGCLLLSKGECQNCIRLGEVLRSMGMIETVISAIFALHPTQPRYNVSMCVLYLVEDIQQGHPYLLRALRSGLLRLIITLGSSTTAADMSDEDGIPANITIILREILPQALVHRAVVAQLQRSLEEVTNLPAAFKSSAFMADWNVFVDSATEHMECYERWKANSKAALKACDNMKCGKIAAKAQFKCCATCRTVNYCSVDCQAVDWCEGHREVCDKLRLVKFSFPETLSKRGKSFLRFVVTEEHARRMTSILVNQALFMRDHPGTPFLTTFRYIKAGGVRLQLSSQDAIRPLIEAGAWKVQVPALFSRAARSGGRMDIHLVSIYEGGSLRHVMMPMRMSSTRLHDTRMRGLEALPPGMTWATLSHAVHAAFGALAEEVRNDESFVMLH
ncbi:hypothetical protein C8R46DRAFT_259346 [Mycena filopes]|nr:hypothetical protein C8R46DRAFT_259346 [Mycena filopes]